MSANQPQPTGGNIPPPDGCSEAASLEDPGRPWKTLEDPGRPAPPTPPGTPEWLIPTFLQAAVGQEHRKSPALGAIIKAAVFDKKAPAGEHWQHIWTCNAPLLSPIISLSLRSGETRAALVGERMSTPAAALEKGQKAERRLWEQWFPPPLGSEWLFVPSYREAS